MDYAPEALEAAPPGEVLVAAAARSPSCVEQKE
jgi:hypothetical protein